MRAVRRSASLVAVLAALWGLWEGWHWIGTHFDLTWPFAVNDITMPHLHRIVQALFEPAQVNGPRLIDILWHASLFTAKESAVGFALGAVIGFAIAVVLSQSRFLERGFIPYIVASQTVPLLAIAPMVVVGLGSKGVRDWVSVAVIAAYLTFFPVTINTLRGLQSADPRAVELMRSYAAGRWAILWKLRVPASLPFLFAALKGLSKRFAAGTVALQGIDLEVQPREFVSLLGPSGCGKSTLLRIIGDLIQPTEGDLVVNGKSAHRARVDRDYGIVFQDAVLYDWRTVARNIALPLELAGWNRRRRTERVKEMVGLVELSGFESHHPWQLSGGMQQRVSIARALSFSPALLLMDEPFGALDEMTRERLNLELLRIWEQSGSTIVFVTHSIAEAVFLSTRVA